MGRNTSKSEALPVAALILAAGESKRFGSPKALAKIGNRTALETLVEKSAAAGLSPVIVVTGAAAERVETAAKDCQFVRNPHYSEGQTSSVQAGLHALSPEVEGAALFLVDQPFARADTNTTLLDLFRSDPNSIVRPRFKNRGGHPVFLPKRIWKEILKLPSSESLRALLKSDSHLKEIEVSDAGVTAQFNTADEYTELLKSFLR
jgi:molybdenum cofactor cytidylyltransferase